ncbi:Ham1 family protein [Actinopolyspora xinjiangensis]|uniref:Ham1 family protein n=1 Tax=Actinopolyspora xinjiangensis TaxID=405564 RepID=A0A1H0W2Y9_9ACTN|nr:non-canonical purine NTP pyrophosphatase [Actinopolyspora xinjiangensis]SDP85097.1 Ham1 family protein [Actinopolyspora xinjiangensis]
MGYRETRTSAELSAAEKDADSHRGRALRELLPHPRKLAA